MHISYESGVLEDPVSSGRAWSKPQTWDSS